MRTHQCYNGYVCGYTCIERKDQCIGGLIAEQATMLNHLGKLIRAHASHISAKPKLIGKGTRANVYDLGNGTVEKQIRPDGVISRNSPQQEVAIQNLAADAGLAVYAKLIGPNALVTTKVNPLDHGKGSQISAKTFGEMLMLIAKLHQAKIAHTDISTKNFARSADGKLLLIDFGEAVLLDQLNPNKQQLLRQKDYQALATSLAAFRKAI